MGRKGSVRGPSGERCFLLGPFCSDTRIGAPLHREALSLPLARMRAGLAGSQLRFLLAPCVPGVCLAVVAVAALALAAGLASGWRAFARASSILAHPCIAAGLWCFWYAQMAQGKAPSEKQWQGWPPALPAGPRRRRARMAAEVRQ